MASKILGLLLNVKHPKHHTSPSFFLLNLFQGRADSQGWRASCENEAKQSRLLRILKLHWVFGNVNHGTSTHSGCLNGLEVFCLTRRSVHLMSLASRSVHFKYLSENGKGCGPQFVLGTACNVGRASKARPRVKSARETTLKKSIFCSKKNSSTFIDGVQREWLRSSTSETKRPILRAIVGLWGDTSHQQVGELRWKGKSSKKRKGGFHKHLEVWEEVW